jgi:hypothetical protein
VISALPVLRAAGPWAWAHRTLVLLVLLAVAFAGWGWSCRSARSAERRAGAAQEGQGAAAHGFVVPVVAGDSELKAQATELLERNADLAAGKTAAEAEVGRLTLRYVIHGRVSGPIQAKSRPPDPSGATPPVPVLAQGDVIDLELEGVGLEGPRGAQLALATVAARRGSDGEILLRRLLTAPVTQVAVDETIGGAPPVRPGRSWRAGPIVGGQAGAGGVAWLVGGQVVWGNRWTLAGAGGPGPDRKGSALVLGGVVF